MTRTQLLVAKNKRRQQIRRDVEAWTFILLLVLAGLLPIVAINLSEKKEVITVNVCNEDGSIHTETWERCYIKIDQEEK